MKSGTISYPAGIFSGEASERCTDEKGIWVISGSADLWPMVRSPGTNGSLLDYDVDETLLNNTSNKDGMTRNDGSMVGIACHRTNVWDRLISIIDV